ncbi:hypothetical protein [Janthinobacterium sp. PC23-8]|uniref:hypothetical protein n=1 Tax=Janthinobacterium sp. PC23-8 TaxID=2012679 RepID=UPI00114086D0|nr:hypothetical protein [Janthinobacterium sp. PC23-8]
MAGHRMPASLAHKRIGVYLMRVHNRRLNRADSQVGHIMAANTGWSIGIVFRHQVHNVVHVAGVRNWRYQVQSHARFSDDRASARQACWFACGTGRLMILVNFQSHNS